MALRDDAPVDAAVLTTLLAEVQGLRAEVAALRLALQATGLPSGSPLDMPAAASATTWLQRPNPQRLAAEVQRRQALQGAGPATADIDTDTELDLLIDRLHDLALDNGG